MVMEETPSPHCVGREFVRQYYTLLNQAPMHLHRFYNENSSFVHGGLDTPNRETKPVIGQRQIHHRIQQLEFNDCHAKIRQVDSQATLGNGVVVQVTGELSNNGEPMRRFTQTFVLAQQSPKKYYVHNDIFRYQDEMVADEECEPDSGRSEAEEDLDDVQAEATVGVTVTQPVPPTFYMSPAPSQQAPAAIQLPNAAPVAAAPAAAAAATATTPNPVNTLASSGLNGSAVAEEVIAPAATPAALVSATPPVVSNASVVVKLEVDEADADDEAEEVVSKAPEVAPQPEQEPPVVVNVEPKTYATLVKSGGASSAMMASSGPLRPPSPVAAAPENNVSNATASGPGATGNANPSADNRNSNVSGANQQAMPQRSPQQAQPVRGGMAGSAAAPSSGSGNMRSGAGPRSGAQDRRDAQNRDSMMEERRRMSGGPLGAGTNMYPDNQQVFVGNVPLAATEENMREIFTKFGSVLDVRLNCKPSNKCPPGKVFPKYGFIVFTDPAAVQLCLQSRPIAMAGDTPHNLNVEEKRNKYRPQMNDERGMGGSRPSMGRAGSGGNMMRGRGSEGGMSRGRGGSMRGGSEGGRGNLRGVGGSNYTRLR